MTAFSVKSIDACTLVTADTAGKLVGASLSQVSAVSEGLTSTCVYASTGTTSGVAIFVEQVPSGDAKKVMQAALDRNTPPGTTLTSVKGIGEAAGTKVDAHAAAVAFAKRQVFVIVTATSGSQSGGALLPKLESLAKQLAAKF